MKIIAVVPEELNSEFQTKSEAFRKNARRKKKLEKYDYKDKEIVRFLEKDLNLEIYKKGFWREFFLDRSEIFYSLRDLLGDEQRKLPGDLEVISIEDARRKYAGTRNLQLSKYTYHPVNPKKLAPFEHFHTRLANERDFELLSLLGKMGAQEVTIEYLNEASNRGNAEIALGVDGLGELAKASAGVSFEKKSESSLVYHFGRSLSSLSEIPEDLLNHSDWFSNDLELQEIFTSRKNSNLLRFQYRTKYDYSYDFDFDFATKYLRLMNLKTEYESISKVQRTFLINFYNYDSKS